MEFSTITSPFIHNTNSVNKIMLQVLIALIPGVVAIVWYFGPGVLVNICLATVTAVVAEASILKIRQHQIMPALKDLSAVVTAVLLAIALPPFLPWWQTMLGTAFAIIVVKHLYGGIGNNPFNPAMAGYVLLLISYPVDMTRWAPPSILNEHPLDFMQALTVIFTGVFPPDLTWDMVTSATPLDEMRTQLGQNQMISEIRQSSLWGDYGGLGWEWIANWFLVGGIYLIWKRVISWHIPVSMLVSLALIAGIFWLADQETHVFPAFHLFSGGIMLGAFFIATDPVTACTTKKGQIIYGALIGIMIYVIRSWGSYPDAVAFSVLLMNMAVPTIDYYSQPRLFGDNHDKAH